MSRAARTNTTRRLLTQQTAGLHPHPSHSALSRSASTTSTVSTYSTSTLLDVDDRRIAPDPNPREHANGVSRVAPSPSLRGGKLTSLKGVPTAASSVSMVYNSGDAAYRLVSSDRVLFCVAADLLSQITGLWDMVQLNSAGGEIILQDPDFEHGYAIRHLLDLLSAGVRSLTASGDVERLSDTIDLCLKYDCRVGYELCLLRMTLDMALEPCSELAAGVFLLAAQVEEEPLASLAAGRMLMDGATLSRNQAALTSSHYLWALGAVGEEFKNGNVEAGYASFAKCFETQLGAVARAHKTDSKPVRTAGRKVKASWRN